MATGPHHEGELDVGPQLDQAELADLREGPVAARPGRGPTEGGGVGVRVGDVEDRAIDAHQAEPAVEGPGRLGLGQGMDDLLEQVADRGDAQASPGHAQAGPMRGLLRVVTKIDAPRITIIDGPSVEAVGSQGSAPARQEGSPLPPSPSHRPVG